MQVSYLSYLVPALLLFISCQPNEPDQASMEYPSTKKTDHVDTYHGEEVEDPYHWLEDDMSDETGKWVEAENELTFGYLDQIEFREPLKERLRQLLDYERISAPRKEGEYTYYSKNDGLQKLFYK